MKTNLQRSNSNCKKRIRVHSTNYNDNLLSCLTINYGIMVKITKYFVDFRSSTFIRNLEWIKYQNQYIFKYSLLSLLVDPELIIIFLGFASLPKIDNLHLHLSFLESN